MAKGGEHRTGGGPEATSQADAMICGIVVLRSPVGARRMGARKAETHDD
jgi:hypothetical protein